ncbi:MAG: CotH kinase family protein, partial [Oscillospiraceae bacterium]|nr:CotH kinase family protein [Oscillospiraceae bacterium]
KDYLVYTMMNEFGANAPLCSFVYITVNGEDWGLYLAVEGIEESFLQRNYGNDYGELYKPDSMNFGGGRGNGKGFDMNEFAENFENGEFQMPSSEDFGTGATPGTSSGENFGNQGDFGGFGNMMSPDMQGGFNGEMPSDFSGMTPPDMNGGFDGELPEDFSGEMPSDFGGMMGGSGMGSDDVKLKYIDDDPESYSNIFNSAKTDITKADKTRLIESLETLSTGKNVEHAVDIEAVLRYFVVHNYAVNGDSYTGSMIHNYYLYEEDGKLSMIPWDYNLAFGTFQSSNASSAVNDSIDSPLSVSGSGDRPMADWIFQNEEYTELYHEYFEKFLETVDVQKIIEDAEAIIAPYIEKDPTKFYTFEEFEKGIETLKEFCVLRTESVERQLSEGEKFAAVDASHLNLSDMGSMGMGGGKGGFGGENFDRNSGGRGENPDESQDNSNKNNTSSSNDQTKAAPPEFSPDDFQIGGARNPFERTDFSSDTGNSLFSNVFYIIASAAVLAVGLVIVFVFKR